MSKPTIEMRPHGSGWARVPAPPAVTGTLALSCWTYGRITVMSALEIAKYPDGDDVGPQWHISISRRGARPGQGDVRKALRSFGMVGTEEDNHHPGNARHFWLPCDPAHRVNCECKADETTVTEADGYQWTTPRDESECRGCDFQRVTGKPCPIHVGRSVEATP